MMNSTTELFLHTFTTIDDYAYLFSKINQQHIVYRPFRFHNDSVVPLSIEYDAKRASYDKLGFTAAIEHVFS